MNDPESPKQHPKSRARWVKVVLAVATLGILIFGLNRALAWTLNLIGTMNSISDSRMFANVMAGALAVYAIMIAIPFMPGVEVGIALLLLRGAEIAPFVYVATVFGLMLSYSLGRWIPLPVLHRWCSNAGLRKVAAFLLKMEMTAPEDRLEAQRQKLPKWLAKLTVDYRYVTLAVLINMPGSFAIGGGGGIALAAGFSRLFNSWYVLLTLLIATSPVPLTVWLLGREAIAR